MKNLSFDPLRTLGYTNTHNVKPADFLQHKDEIQQADWVLFPEYWQVNALIYGLKARVFPSQASYLLGHNKIEMTRAFQTVAPEHTPATTILANTPENAERVWQDMATPFVAKHPKSAQGVGVWLINTLAEWREYQQQCDVLYVQEYLPIDADVRVVVIGDQVFTAYWRKQSSDGFHNNVSRGGEVDFSNVPEAAKTLALRLARDLGVDHAGFDIAMIGDYPFVFEFNRIFGNAGLDNEKLRDAICAHLKKQLNK